MNATGKAGSGAAKPPAAAGGNSGSNTDVMTANAGAMSMNGNSPNDSGNNHPPSNSGAAGQNAMSTGGQAAPAVNPANTAAACTGHAGETVCDNTTLYACAEMSAVMTKQSCTNAKRCQAGTKTGECGMCDPGQFQCVDAELQECDETGKWTMSMTCPSKELCSMTNHTCDPMACAKDAYDCSGGELRKCSEDLTEFKAVMPCDMELCDSMAGKCNECVPNSNNCDDSGSSVIACSADGKKMTMACSGSTPFCTQGKCVACKTDTDCKATSDCRIPACSAGMCTLGTSKPVHTACSTNAGKVCDLIGNCVACFDDTDCSPSQRCNPVNLITPCEARQPLEFNTSLLPGTYSITVAPGFDVQLSTPDTTLQSMLRVTMSDRPFNQECALGWAGGTCTIAKSSDARTMTITGPGSCSSQNLQNQLNAGRSECHLTFSLSVSTGAGGAPADPCMAPLDLKISAVSK